MTTFVALLRAVNVSGRNRIPMAELRRALAGLGLTAVETYLQSGNVVFDAQGDASGAHAAAIHGLIEREFGHDVRVLVRTAAEFARIATANPFLAGAADQTHLHVTFLVAPAEEAAFGGRDLPAQEGERAERAGPVVYLSLPHGYGRTKLNNAWLERALGTSATTRNWRTVVALVEMSAHPLTDWDARDYAAHSAAQQEWARELIAKLRLRGDEALLDIGCGDGRATAQIAERLPKGSVLGVDKSASMIALAGEQFPPAAQPNLSFRQMDAAGLDLPRAFDVAFSTAALHWVDDHEAVLRGVRRCLRPGGRLLFQMGGRGNAAAVVAVVAEVTAQPRWRGSFDGFSSPYHFYSPEDYEAWLPRAGFCARRAELLTKDMKHAGREAFLGWLRTTWFPYTDRLPAELREAFLDDAAAAYIVARPPDGQGVIHVRMVRLEVEAEVA